MKLILTGNLQVFAESSVSAACIAEATHSAS